MATRQHEAFVLSQNVYFIQCAIAIRFLTMLFK